MGLKAYHGGPLVGRELRTIREDLPTVEARVAAIYRHDRPIIPEGDTIIEPNDEVFIVAAAPHIPIVMSEFCAVEAPGQNIMLVGAGKIGLQLARTLEQNNYQVKLVEHGAERARQVAEQLDATIVLRGDAADEDLMLRENIDAMDVFCSLTNDDEANILSAMLAKRLGAHRAMALINRSAYVDLIESSVLDVAISPSLITVGSLLTHVRRGDTIAVHSLRRGAAEAIETIAHGDATSSSVVGRRIEEISLPSGTRVGALLRNQEVIIPHHDTVIEAEDHVILFVIDKKHIRDVERSIPGESNFRLNPRITRVQHQAVLKIVGILLTLFSTTLLPPLAISVVNQDGSTLPFVISYLITLAAGLLLLVASSSTEK